MNLSIKNINYNGEAEEIKLKLADLYSFFVTHFPIF